MTSGGLLTVAADAEPDRVRIALRDTGPGIPAEHRARIFDPFFSTKDTGTGLGLALVHQIVADHGGTIEVQAPAEGGSLFVITLPAAPGAVEAPPVTDGEAPVVLGKVAPETP
jgi:signal transduction histidine kinase